MMNVRLPQLRSLSLLILACCVLAGCGLGVGGPQRAAVRGTITVDGKPVENGSIQFVPIEGTTGPVAGGIIEDGSYAVAKAEGPVVGTHRVEIHGSRKTGRTVAGPMGQTIEEYAPVVPEQYNTASTLTRSVEAGSNVLDFELSSQ